MLSMPLTAIDGEQIIQQQGDVLAMPAVAAAANLPRNGIDKIAVEKRFGSPLRKDSAVGDPPISVWYYDDFKVFFEYQLVLHSVSENRKPTLYSEPE